MAQDKPLFDPALIPSSVLESLPDGYTIRPLRRSDYARGFLDCLRLLTVVGDISQPRWEERYDYMASHEGYYIIVVEGPSRDTIVGTGALIVERKFIHDLGSVGHIEDIAVARDQQGKKLGLRIIQVLDQMGQSLGCYKTILDCNETNEGFYVKCGYKRVGLEMSHKYGDQ